MIVRESMAEVQGSKFKVQGWNAETLNLKHGTLNLSSFLHPGDVGIEFHREAVDLAGAHHQRMVAHEELQVVNFAVVRAIRGIGGDHVGLLPRGLEVVFQDAATMAGRAE